MSIIDKKPFIVKVIETMSAADKATLKSLINGGGDGPISRTIISSPGITVLSTSDKGVHEMNLKVSDTRAQGTYLGYLIYNNTYCVLVSYSNKTSQQLTLIELFLDDAGNWSYDFRNCELSILELRSELDDASEASGELTPEEAAWVSENSEKRILCFYEVNDIKNISENILNKLQCGDVVVKKTTEGSRHLKHAYQVSYYEDKHGCCLTYTAAGYIETQSYDYIDGHWVYNSQDLWQAE